MTGEQTQTKVARRRKELSYCMLVLEEILTSHRLNMLVIWMLISIIISKKTKKTRRFWRNRFSLLERIPPNVHHINRLVGVTDQACVDNLRMDRNTFGRLCRLLKDVSGLVDKKWVTVEEMVAMFLGILAHHNKTRVVGFHFIRSSQTVSRYLHVVLYGLLKLHEILLVKPEPVDENCTEARWKWFKGCLGALDGTHINVRVPATDLPRYRNRKGQIATNTLAVCDRRLRFVYVLPGWEGSAGDSRILRDALSRPLGFKVPRGQYYLCDNGYANSEGFITPYKGVRYHLKEWGPSCQAPQTPAELFNMRHTKARNIIERAFAVMKMRWGILRNASFYPIDVQTDLINACFLLHNFIRGQMEIDPIEVQMDSEGDDGSRSDPDDDRVDFIQSIEPTTAWAKKRDDLAAEMWLDFNS